MNQQTGEFRNDDNSEGQASHARQKRAPGAISVATSFPPRPVPKPARQRVRGLWCFHRSPPRRRLPDLSSPPQWPLQAAGSASDFRGSWRLGARNPITFPKGAPSARLAAKGERGSGSRRSRPSPAPRVSGPGSLGPGEARRARPGAPRCLRDYLSFRAACGAAPTSSRLSGRRLAQGFPAARPRPIGAARAVPEGRTHAHPRVHASHARPPRRARPPAPPRGRTRLRAGPAPLLQVGAWTLRPGPLEAAP